VVKGIVAAAKTQNSDDKIRFVSFDFSSTCILMRFVPRIPYPQVRWWKNLESYIEHTETKDPGRNSIVITAIAIIALLSSLVCTAMLLITLLSFSFVMLKYYRANLLVSNSI
jgi:hypothetical protein